MSTRVRLLSASVAIAFAASGAATASASAMTADRDGAPGPGASARPATIDRDVNDAVRLRPAAATGALPSGCLVVVGEPTGEAYLEGRKVSTWTKLKLPKSARFTGIESPLNDDAWHHIAVDPSGRAYDSSLEYGVVGDLADLNMLEQKSVGIGSTLEGIVDLESGAEYTDKEPDAVRPTKIVYAITSNGRMHALPVTFVKGRPRLGKPIELKAKGLSGLRGIETQGRYWSKDKVTKDVLLAHTKDGHFVELTVNRAGSRPSLSYRTIAARVWGQVSAIATGWCEGKALQSTTVIVAIGANRSVTAYLDPRWDDASLKGAKTIRLNTWKRAAPSTLF